MNNSSKGVTRREAILLLAALGSTAVAIGSNLGSTQPIPSISLPNTLLPSPTAVNPTTAAPDTAADVVPKLMQDLAHSQEQLQAALAAQRTTAESLAQAQLEITTLRQQLLSNQQQQQDFQGLVQLWEQLDSNRWVEMTEQSLGQLQQLWQGVAAFLPLFQDGSTLGSQLLRQFTETLAGLRQNLGYTADVWTSLESLLQTARTAISQLWQTTDVVREPLEQFTQYVLDHLPFDIGKAIARPLQAIQATLQHIPDSIQGSRQWLFQPLQTYLDDQLTHGWQQSLAQPLQQALLNPLQQFIAHWQQTEQQLNDQVLQPLQSAQQQRAELREKIRQYRQQHNI